MNQERLNDAAIALHGALSEHGVQFGIFGGYAVITLASIRITKDIDCLASVTKDQAIRLLDGKHGFAVIPQSRQDYVAFLWSNQPDRRRAVLVEIFCEQFPGAQYSMSALSLKRQVIHGAVLGQGTSNFLSAFQLFKGKLRAAATRNKFHDAADLRALESKYREEIKSQSQGLSLSYVGLAMKRYPELVYLFERLGVDVQRAKELAEDIDLAKLPPPEPGDVQRGLLA
ncbi:hypothetical protein CCM_00579 [Cordyceps militaris CM01]|uniref:Nucleotidyl transferase n=1 Tax=Cordyceps militaris (strain CM01) TaxID=983644 RepID=G3J4V8_CORMM|nr:uncharacterized protein CCM_00579 [Cordyceps militaris CM01]EGX95925.1 hypothetical protein CCM_00579 [Cordyceps militaris CM01]